MMMKEKKRVPMLRFEGFEGEWEKMKYKNIYSFIITNSYSRIQLNYEEGEVKNIHYGDIHTKFPTLFDITKELVPFINSDINISRYKEENYCKEGDLVIADASEDYADVGKTIEIVNLNEEKVLAGLHTFLARPKDNKMSIGFSGYMLQSWPVRKQVMTIAQGTKVRGIASGRLGNILLTIPDKKEQQKIASFLTSIDTRIQQLEKKRTLLEQYKKGVMQQLFKQEVRFKDKGEEEFPKWEKKALGKTIQEYKQKSKVNDEYDVLTSSNKGLMLQSEYYGDSRLIGRDNKGFNIIPEYYITFRSRSDNRKFTFNLNDLGFTGIISIYYPVFKPLKGNAKFLVEFLNYYQNYIGRFSVGTSQTVLSYNELAKIKFEIPSEKEQTKIAHFLSSVDKKIAVVDEQIERTKEWKKGLLQRMFV